MCSLSIVNILQQLELQCDFDETKQAFLSWSEVNETFFFLLFVHKQKDWWKDWKENNRWLQVEQMQAEFMLLLFWHYLFLASYCLETLWRKLYSREKNYVIENLDNDAVLLTGHHSHWCEKRKKLLKELVIYRSAVVPVLMLWK